MHSNGKYIIKIEHKKELEARSEEITENTSYKDGK